MKQEETNNQECVLIKRKDLEELERKAESKKPDEINVHLMYRDSGYIGDPSIHLNTTLSLHENLRSQIMRMISLHREKIVKKVNEDYDERVKEMDIENGSQLRKINSLKEGIRMNSDELTKISKMTVREFRRWRKQYKHIV